MKTCKCELTSFRSIHAVDDNDIRRVLVLAFEVIVEDLPRSLGVPSLRVQRSSTSVQEWSVQQLVGWAVLPTRKCGESCCYQCHQGLASTSMGGFSAPATNDVAQRNEIRASRCAPYLNIPHVTAI